MDKVVVITGGAGGIGQALARAFREEGDTVELLDLNGPIACDVTDPDACRRAIDTVLERHGRIDILVNNAGISHFSSFADTDLGVIRKVMDVNFFGAVHCTAAALDALVASRGQIVAISSVAGFAPLLGRTGYAASKHAMHGFFDSLRVELADRGVNVLVVCPYFVASGMHGHLLNGDGGRSAPPPTGRNPLSPDQVAAAVVDGCRRRRRQVVLSPIGRASWWVAHLAPALYDRLMRRTQRAGAHLGDSAQA